MLNGLPFIILHQSDLLCSLLVFWVSFILQKNFGVSIHLIIFHQMLLSCCSIFNELCRLASLVFRPALADSLHIISHHSSLVNTFFQLFLNFFHLSRFAQLGADILQTFCIYVIMHIRLWGLFPWVYPYIRLFNHLKLFFSEVSVKVQMVLTETTAISRANKH